MHARELTDCEGKVRFDSPELARKVQKRRARNDKNGDVYKCRFCRGWHIGRRSDAR